MTTHTSPDHARSDGHPSPAGPLHRWVLPIRAPTPVNPVLVKHAERRAEYEQKRIADAKRQVIADRQWRTVQEEDQQNKQLLGL